MAGGDQSLVMLLGVLRALAEVAGYFLLGQGALYVIAGAGRERNAIYRIFRFLTRPVVRLFRALLPAAVPDARVPLVAFVALFIVWLLLAWWRWQLCAGVCA